MAIAVRAAQMTLHNGPAGGAVLTATVPNDMTEKDFTALGRSIRSVSLPSPRKTCCP